MKHETKFDNETEKSELWGGQLRSLKEKPCERVRVR